jgi:hypothetical protein
LWPERIKGRRWWPKTAAGRQEKDPSIQRAGCQVLQATDWAMESNLRRLLQIVSGLAENTNSIFCDGPGARDNEWMSGSATGTTLRDTDASCRPGSRYFARPQGRARRIASSLDKRLTWTSGRAHAAMVTRPPNRAPSEPADNVRGRDALAVGDLLSSPVVVGGAFDRQRTRRTGPNFGPDARAHRDRFDLGRWAARTACTAGRRDNARGRGTLAGVDIVGR